MIALSKVLPAPEKKPANLPPSSKWLAGEGAGSWFTIEKTKTKNVFEISRFSPDGKGECEGFFTNDVSFNIEKGYELTYPSHCAVVTVIQNAKSITFNPISPAGIDNIKNKGLVK